MFRILVAEDDESTRLLMCEVLRQAGYEPCPACNGVEALEVMEHYQCDLVVVDITVPSKLSAEERKLVEQLAAQPSFQKAESVKNQNIFERMKSFFR